MNTNNETSLRILLVSSSEAMRNEVLETLIGDSHKWQLSWVSQSELAVSRAEELVPQIVLVDDDLEGISAALLIKQLGAHVPHAAVLFLAEQGAMADASRAVLAGARGFLAKPLDRAELWAGIDQVLEQKRYSNPEPSQLHRPSGRVIVFCAPKGGTGRTTLAINTAVSLHKSSGESVVIVDADYAAPALDVALNLPTERSIADLLPRLAALDEDLLNGVLVRHASGIHALLAPAPSRYSSTFTVPQVEQILMMLKRMFTWVLVDLGLPLNETANAFLDSANRVVMNVLPEMVGLRNARLMLEQLGDSGNGEQKTWVVLNRANMTGGVPKADIENHLHVPIKHSIPDDQSLVTHSINRGVPVMMARRRGALVRGYQKFGEALREEVPTRSGLEETQALVTAPIEKTHTKESLRSGYPQPLPLRG